MRRTSRLSWDGERPVSSIYDVWDFLSIRLRQLGEKLRQMDDRFYGDDDRKSYIETVFVSLKRLSSDARLSPETVTNLDKLKTLALETDGKVVTSRIRNAQAEILAFFDRLQQALPDLSEVKDELVEHVLRHLETYCYDYQKLGITDDTFYRKLRIRIVRMKEILENFTKIMCGVRDQSSYSQHFSESKFSQEIAITFDCETFPILRACPDMIQKLYVTCDIAQDWLRSDKVYVEEMEKQIEQTKTAAKEKENQLNLTKLEYSKIFSSLKHKQNYLDFSDHHDDSLGGMKKDISRLETTKYRLEMEIIAVNRLLATCKDSLRNKGLRSTESPTSSEEGLDEVDNCNPERCGIASSRYRDRVCRDSRVYQTKLQELKKRLQKLQHKINRKKETLRDIESGNAEIDRLTRKLKVVAQKKAQHREELHVLNDHLRQLEKMLTHRKRPNARTRKIALDETDDVTSSLDLDSSANSVDFSQRGDGLSADLRRAFRVIKNNIGHGWKDLARTLSYNPEKGLSEINNDIREIEYDNPGQLKEQAYQCLVRWYNHNGRRASLRELHEALREINENRIADKLQGHYLPKRLSLSCENSPRASDSGID